MKIKKHRFQIEVVQFALEMREVGHNYRKISSLISKTMNVKVSHKTVFEWCHKFKMSDIKEMSDENRKKVG